MTTFGSYQKPKNRCGSRLFRFSHCLKPNEKYRLGSKTPEKDQSFRIGLFLRLEADSKNKMQQSGGLLLDAGSTASTHLFSFPIGNENANESVLPHFNCRNRRGSPAGERTRLLDELRSSWALLIPVRQDRHLNFSFS